MRPGDHRTAEGNAAPLQALLETLNVSGASLETFAFCVEWAATNRSGADIELREERIAALERGENLFNEATLERLRSE